ncbi:hypothetical protein BaRGS_00004468 [Batillaria attramentaria]|uniref:Secreted protein n=1 Tax=Batillaria attramentaria TaxID=370345 RepID=A0ABD0LX38_9CAEN
MPNTVTSRLVLISLSSCSPMLSQENCSNEGDSAVKRKERGLSPWLGRPSRCQAETRSLALISYRLATLLAENSLIRCFAGVHETLVWTVLTLSR